MQLVYSGAHPEVVIDELDQDLVIKAGEPVEIPDDLAARLIEQSTWARVTPSVSNGSPQGASQGPLSTPVEGTPSPDATKVSN